MAVVGALLNNVVQKKVANFKRKQTTGQEVQLKTLKKLLWRARNTQIGKAYGFEEILYADDVIRKFRQQVPPYYYEKIYQEWWHKLSVEGERNVCWPGKVKYFGMTAGVVENLSPQVPLTNDMIRAIRKIGIRQLLVLSDYQLPPRFYEKSALICGGSVALTKMQNYFESDLKGLVSSRMPFWYNTFYRFGRPSAKEKDWKSKINKIIDQAPKLDIGGISGVPERVQVLLEKVVERYHLKDIHEIWPNFRVFAHGGASIEPYQDRLKSLLGEEVICLNTYLTSEGFIAYQQEKGSDMQLVLDNGIFFEFVPYSNQNFSSDGRMNESPEVIEFGDIEEGRDYALLISTCAGAWRYLMGDTIRFTDKEKAKMIITGRIKESAAKINTGQAE